jgi:hypothetical protein
MYEFVNRYDMELWSQFTFPLIATTKFMLLELNLYFYY